METNTVTVNCFYKDDYGRKNEAYIESGVEGDKKFIHTCSIFQSELFLHLMNYHL